MNSQVVRMLCLPAMLLACDMGPLADADAPRVDEVDALDGLDEPEPEPEPEPAQARPDGPADLTVEPEDPEAGLVCGLLCLLAGNHPKCGDDGVTYANACLAHCNGAEVVPKQSFYPDDDSDGHGDSHTAPVLACSAPAGTVPGHDDCDDADEQTHPGASELCDGTDNDCDGTTPVDETADHDADGRSACSDCDDDNSAVYPGAPEICDGLDDDCDGAVPAGEADLDGDAVAICAGDCDDGDAAVNPGHGEVCDGKDNDCDGTLPANEVDQDGDGLLVCEQDCNDGDASVGPGIAELCDGIDNDCNGSVDDGAASQGSPNGQGQIYALTGPVIDLPLTGNPNAGAFVDACACGSVAVGIRGVTLRYFHWPELSDFSLICERLDADGTPGQRTTTPTRGSFDIDSGEPAYGVSPFTAECPFGEVMVGQSLRQDADAHLVSIAVDCAPLADVLAGLSSTSTVLGPFMDAAAVPVGPANAAHCGAGQVIRGVHGTDGLILDGVGLACQTLVLQ